MGGHESEAHCQWQKGMSDDCNQAMKEYHQDDDKEKEEEDTSSDESIPPQQDKKQRKNQIRKKMDLQDGNDGHNMNPKRKNQGKEQDNDEDALRDRKSSHHRAKKSTTKATAISEDSSYESRESEGEASSWSADEGGYIKKKKHRKRTKKSSSRGEENLGGDGRKRRTVKRKKRDKKNYQVLGESDEDCEEVRHEKDKRQASGVSDGEGRRNGSSSRQKGKIKVRTSKSDQSSGDEKETMPRKSTRNRRRSNESRSGSQGESPNDGSLREQHEKNNNEKEMEAGETSDTSKSEYDSRRSVEKKLRDEEEESSEGRMSEKQHKKKNKKKKTVVSDEESSKDSSRMQLKTRKKKRNTVPSHDNHEGREDSDDEKNQTRKQESDAEKCSESKKEGDNKGLQSKGANRTRLARKLSRSDCSESEHEEEAPKRAVKTQKKWNALGIVEISDSEAETSDEESEVEATPVPVPPRKVIKMRKHGVRKLISKPVEPFTDENGKIICQKAHAEFIGTQMARKLFGMVDKDGSGLLDREEILDYIHEYARVSGKKISDLDVLAVMDEVDDNVDFELDEEEFCDFLISVAQRVNLHLDDMCYVMMDAVDTKQTKMRDPNTKISFTTKLIGLMKSKAVISNKAKHVEDNEELLVHWQHECDDADDGGES